MESVHSMLSHARLPDSYWAKTVATAVHVRNRLPTAVIKEDKTPHKCWYGRKPNIGHLKVFGCMAYAHTLDAQRQKLDKKFEKQHFVGYSIQS